MQAHQLLLETMGRRARRLLQQLPASRLHQQRPQHLLRLDGLFPPDP